HHVALKPVIFGSIAARLTGVRSIVNAIAGLGNLAGAKGWKARLLAPSLRIALRIVLDGEGTRVVVQNPEDRDMLVRSGMVKAERSVLIRGAGVDLNRFAPAARPTRIPIVVHCSRMLWSKGVGEFVDAASCLRSQGVKARFV